MNGTRLQRITMILLAVVIATSGCKPRVVPAQRAPEVRYTPVPEPTDQDALWLLTRVPGATIDAGLWRATSLLAAMAVDPTSRLSPSGSADALGAAGYPGHASFAKTLNSGEPPEDLADLLANVALNRHQPIDVALARRNYGDGTTLWIAAYAFRPTFIDPLPRDLALDEMLPVRVTLGETAIGRDVAIFISRPGAPVRALELATDRYQYIDGFHVPGAYRLEVVTSSSTESQVALVWTIYVEEDAPTPAPLPRTEHTPANPVTDTEELYIALDSLRAESGLPALQRFELFEPLAREHAAYMAHTGVVDHTIGGVTEGVATRARAQFHPDAHHHEDLAAAQSWRDALALVTLSPGHLRNLQCESCTHVSIGAALEPSLETAARLYVVWELLEFPQGTPRPLEQWNR